MQSKVIDTSTTTIPRTNLDARDLSPEAAIQYIALHIVEEMIKSGMIKGSCPSRFMDADDRKIANGVLKLLGEGELSFSDGQIEATLMYTLHSIRESGYDISVDSTSALMAALKGNKG